MDPQAQFLRSQLGFLRSQLGELPGLGDKDEPPGEYDRRL